MSIYADLELGLHRHDEHAYAVEIRFNLPDNEAEIHLPGLHLAHFNLEALRNLIFDPPAYAALLTESLFADVDVLAAFSRAFGSAMSSSAILRLRLLIGPSAPELHGLLWELLREPSDHSAICTNQNILFSRYLSSFDWRPVRLRPKKDLRALVAIADPIDLDEYSLAPVKAQEELERARTNLSPMPVSDLRKATLSAILDCMQDGSFDILYLVAHGMLFKERPMLFLCNSEGKVARIPGSEMVDRLKDLQQKPRLIVLASCQSAGRAGSIEQDCPASALSALGPRLAEAGVPAVLAMQGNITMKTVEKFMPVFFRELQRDGQIDRAVTAARTAILHHFDYWMPALFMRLKHGRIWYVPGFRDERPGLEKMPALINRISKGQCTPILGPGLAEPLLGSHREIAVRWSERFHYPMAPHERESLPQVAQFLSINQDHGFPYSELEKHMKSELVQKYAADLPPQSRATLDEMIIAAGARHRKRNPMDAYTILAQLPLPIFITTNQHNLLAAALYEAGKHPEVVICPWNEDAEMIESVYDREPDYRPTPDRPLVYHLFGRLDKPYSVVLTEDDYFDYLIGVTNNRNLIPRVIGRALTDSALLFLGFQLDEWNFRVLFRSILSKEGGRRRREYAHVAAQIEPEEGRFLESEAARAYLEKYFSKDASINIFWGSAEDFLQQLWSEYNRELEG
jgi:hypothetical protein